MQQLIQPDAAFGLLHPTGLVHERVVARIGATPTIRKHSSRTTSGDRVPEHFPHKREPVLQKKMR